MPGEEDAVNGPSEAFGLLANGQRMAIMEALWGRREPVPFKALKAAAGVEDSGRFNYHLGKLGGTYVRKADDGYELTRPGRRVITAVRGGDLLDRPDVGPAEVDWPCPRCGADLELGSSGDVIRVLCNECPGLFRGGSLGRRPRREHPGGTVSILPIPPVGFENRSPTEVLEAAVRWILHRATMQSDGVC
ncbi:MAG: hypothetical protein GWN07_05365, partial [Actinobacteria bacterium]|nr:hypothetical protein [Actinomycetota bacterium]NIX19288.1 hypothetical protein [Actinomycetota bacterium]